MSFQFGQPTAGSTFGASASSGSLFGSGDASKAFQSSPASTENKSSLFSTATATPFGGLSFGAKTTASTNLFSMSATTATASTGSAFGPTKSTSFTFNSPPNQTVGTPAFGLNTQQNVAFGANTQQKQTPAFGVTATQASSPFGSPGTYSFGKSSGGLGFTTPTSGFSAPQASTATTSAAPQTAQSSFSLNTATTVAGLGSNPAFGQTTQAKPFSFGNIESTTTAAPAPGFGANQGFKFASTASSNVTQNPPQFGQSTSAQPQFGQTQNTTVQPTQTVFEKTQAFGATQPAQTQSGLGFGTNTPTQSLNFGVTAQTTQATSLPSFGTSPQALPTSLPFAAKPQAPQPSFGQTATSFGTVQQTGQATSFGTTPLTSQATLSFTTPQSGQTSVNIGATVQSSQPLNFGTTTQSQAAPLNFVTTTQSQPASINFGTTLTSKPAAVSFGTTTPNQAATLSFGTTTQSSQPATLSFGTTTQNSQPTTLSFGLTTQAASSQPTSTFGATTQATSMSFGTAAKPATTSAASTAGLSFGTTALTTSATSSISFGTSTALSFGKTATTSGTTSTSVPSGITALGKTTATGAMSTLTTTTTTVAAAPPAAITSITFAQLEESMNKWTIELEEQEKTFINQATQINAWDRLLISNGEKIVELNDAVETVKNEQQSLEHELDFVLAQQKELENLLAPLEARLAGDGDKTRDPDREHMYSLAESLDTQLRQMSEDLKEVIEHLNETNRGQDTNDPIVQIGRILNAHMSSMQWIDGSIATISSRLEQLRATHDTLRRDNERSFQLTYN